MKYSFMDIIGIDIDNNYKWLDSFFLDDHLLRKNDGKNKYKKNIKIIYNKHIDYSDSREIEKDIFACDKYMFDKKKMVKIYKERDTYVIESNQECNEWFVIVLQLVLLSEDYSIIHAAAVCNTDGEALLLPSWGGVGKTASVSKLVDKGYKLLGDDLNVIKSDGTILGFPKKFVLYYYHKELFPNVFEKKNIKCNNFLNNFYTAIIPTVKKVLRKIPCLLTYARKHNPQSMKVSPFEIFGEEAIYTEKAKISQIMWLDRLYQDNYVKKISNYDLVSKSVSVSMHELFTDNIESILILCGMNLFNYDNVFNKMYQIYKDALSVHSVELNINKNSEVSNVPNEVLKNIKI